MSQGEKILIVEDNDFVRMQVLSYLEDAGYTVIEATNGAMGLTMLAPDLSLVIVDVRMAPIDGFEFIKAVRGRNPTLPLILVTGDQNPDLLNEASKWSVSAVLMKPVQRDRLISMAERAILKVKKR
ncbi:MAG: response regulator [Alphaproteobacteria bacterium]|nr:response regulator [Alphaproteobacteria bacterium]